MVRGMDNKKQMMQLACGQFRLFSAVNTQKIRPKPKLAVAYPTETKTTLKLWQTEFTASFGTETETEIRSTSIYNMDNHWLNSSVKMWFLN